ncbi:hypothetical protein MP638_001482 [Amoeboaphelidium occidentale]|nr:hypothetical protein MP638_001482 [Amoeboaphelidium occidentale]
MFFTMEGAMKELNVVNFAEYFNNSWATFVKLTKNSETNMIELKYYANPQGLHRFRGQLSSWFRVWLNSNNLTLMQTKSEASLLRKTGHLSLIGIVALEGMIKLMKHNYKVGYTRRYSLKLTLAAVELQDVVYGSAAFKDCMPSYAKALNSSLEVCSLLDKSIAHLVMYRNFKQATPESQLVMGLWRPLFQMWYVDPMNGLISGVPEYYLPDSTSGTHQKRLDWATLCRESDGLPPIFFCEASAYPNETEENGLGFFHKDYTKLAWSMAHSFISYASQLKGNVELLKELRIYGALVSQYHIQFVVRFESHPEDSIVKQGDTRSSLIFQTHGSHYMIDLVNCSRTCSTSCEFGICTSSDSSFIPAQEDILANYERTADNDDLRFDMNDHNEENEGSQVPHRDGDETRYCEGIPLNYDTVIDSVMSCILFFQDVQMYETQLHEQINNIMGFDKKKLIKLPEVYKNSFPTSSSIHSSQSPHKNSQTPQSKQHKERSSYNAISSAKNSYCLSTTNHKDSLQELLMLIKLRDAPNVVGLMDYSLTLNSCNLVLEELVQLPPDYENNTIGILYHCCRYLSDISNGIIQLKEHRILHRDISPNNILYSIQDCCWKLIDFDLACFMPEDTDVVKSDGIVGTKGFMAPEVSSEGLYSVQSDVFGLGKSFRSHVFQHLMFCQDMFPEDGVPKLAKTLSRISQSMISDSALDRPFPNIIISTMDDLMIEGLETFGLASEFGNNIKMEE